jgi:hypothetical protein
MNSLEHTLPCFRSHTQAHVCALHACTHMYVEFRAAFPVTNVISYKLLIDTF